MQDKIEKIGFVLKPLILYFSNMTISLHVSILKKFKIEQRKNYSQRNLNLF